MLIKLSGYLIFVAVLFGCTSQKEKSSETKKFIEQHYARGIEYGTQGDFEHAKEELLLVLQRNPFHDAKQRIAAIHYYEKAAVPSEVLLHLFRSVHHSMKNEYDKAIYEINKSIDIASEYDECYRMRGRNYRAMREYSKAIEDYTKAIKLRPDNVDSYINRGVVYSELGLYDDAIEDYNKAIKQNPELVPVYINKALTYEMAGRIEEAIDAYETFIRKASREEVNYQPAIDKIKKLKSRKMHD